jgi:hypothetical protein
MGVKKVEAGFPGFRGWRDYTSSGPHHAHQRDVSNIIKKTWGQPRNRPPSLRQFFEEEVCLDRDDFFLLAWNERPKLLQRWPDQPDGLLDDAFWAAVVESLEKLDTIRNPRAFLRVTFKSRVKDGIRADIAERRRYARSIGARTHYERGLEFQEFGKVVPGRYSLRWVEDPGVVESFGYIDFVRWLKRQDKTDVEVLLQKTLTDVTQAELGKRFGRDRHWAKRVYDRIAKKLVKETGLFPHQIEDMVAEALRRRGPVYPLPVVHVTLGRWDGRETLSFERQEKEERRDVYRHIETAEVEPDEQDLF